ncbi:MAG: Unknown protein [uncultured Thiotrichaceae bacterium]|uniref:Uncharacterized protein n=1 Tax=uncultured Thiotrichaceae bacterium TaxID=298394 RepID=A0A6S6T1Y7_9GAMM|nr:MAG: Unknown protein [uncultured Thiotrichaceae bacterium]
MKKENKPMVDENPLRIPRTIRVLIGVLLMFATVGTVSLHALFG